MATTSRPAQLAAEHNTLTPVSSPKRKRNDDSDDETNVRASPMRLRMELPSRPRPDEDSSLMSPRSKVSKQLNALSLSKPDLSFSTPIMAFGKAPEEKSDSSGNWNMSSPPTDPDTEPSIVSGSCIKTPPPRKPPGTPKLEPTITSDTLIRSPIPLPEPLPSPGQNKAPQSRGKSPPLGSPSASPSTNINSSLTWTEAEITGHNPTDPMDDGTGLNGVGFRPTPAIAYARSRRRKQQVADYMSRESKEARQKRMDRRRKVSAEKEDQASAGRRVRFLEE